MGRPRYSCRCTHPVSACIWTELTALLFLKFSSITPTQLYCCYSRDFAVWVSVHATFEVDMAFDRQLFGERQHTPAIFANRICNSEVRTAAIPEPCLSHTSALVMEIKSILSDASGSCRGKRVAGIPRPDVVGDTTTSALQKRNFWWIS